MVVSYGFDPYICVIIRVYLRHIFEKKTVVVSYGFDPVVVSDVVVS